MKPIDISQYSYIVLLTGAGLSAASGLPTFRGADGISNNEVQWVSDAANLPDSLPGLWKLYGGLRQRALQAEPNAAHASIAALQNKWGATRSITVATQNVDGLHQRAGSPDIIELHGSVLRTRYTNRSCTSAPFEDPTVPQSVLEYSVCYAPLRPDIVLFNEQIPLDAEWRMKHALRDCNLFLAVGTSGTVAPASGFVRGAQYAGARTILVNLTPMLSPNPYFKEEYVGTAEEILPFYWAFNGKHPCTGRGHVNGFCVRSRENRSCRLSRSSNHHKKYLKFFEFCLEPHFDGYTDVTVT